MRYFKLSKASWIILAVGLFIVVMAGLGITRSQQAKEQGRLDDELAVSQQLLASLDIADLQADLEELEQAAEEGQTQLDEARALLDQSVVSVDVTDEFFDIASACGVLVVNLSTTPIVPNIYDGIGLSMTTLDASVEGEVPALIDFVERLHADFTTGLVTSTQIDVPTAPSEEGPSATVQILIYSYEGSDNG
jgi:hypothetical protein